MADAGAKVRTIADVMSRPPVTATEGELVAEAASRMAERWDTPPTFRYLLDGDDPGRVVVTRR